VRPKLDYSAYFDDTIGETPGLTIWRLENFAPTPIPKGMLFFICSSTRADFFYCFQNHTELSRTKIATWFWKRSSRKEMVGYDVASDVFVSLTHDSTESRNLDWHIYFWIGGKAQLDKKASAAIHAVNLRNFLGASTTSQREEQGDESFEFMLLFGNNIDVVEGRVFFIYYKLRFFNGLVSGGTESGFFKIEEEVTPTRLFLLHGGQTVAHAMPLSATTLHTEHIFLLDTPTTFFLWRGTQTSSSVLFQTYSPGLFF
jgi:hypothetical protein